MKEKKMEASECANKIELMYREFCSTAMKLEFIKILLNFSPQQIDRIYLTYVQTVPAGYTPDIKNLMGVISKAGLELRGKKTICPSCHREIHSTCLICDWCKYDFFSDGDPVQYREEWSGQEGQRRAAERIQFINEIMVTLTRKIAVN